MPVFFKHVMAVLCWPARWVSWLTLPLIVTILLSVVLAKMGQNSLIAWDDPIPVLGRGLTVNSLFDVQWYIFALLVLFGGVWALRDDRHVSVDFLSLMMSPRQRLWVRMLGDLFFLLPFCVIIAWYGWNFAGVAWRTAEASTQGGLNSRWLIKAVVPLSFGMLALLGLTRAIGTAIQLAKGDLTEDIR
ncbi:TRAP transporter small permease subunit [Pararhodobacter zhoushanensis]|uniref:TRAP transporter small permease subunit n=1 Tax=Pararhodobacter zhoushanensis TaxID=2479545 RepID=UPI000F8EBB4C|nr:TRAP transporter small permease subunit [Pararhodobacter zhoushanensis]